MNEATRRCLLILGDKERLPLSSLGRRVRRDIEPLIAAGVLKIIRSGAGEAVLVQNTVALDQFMQTHFPENQLSDNLPARAKAVRGIRNSKQAKKREDTIMILRALRPFECRINDQPLDLTALTKQCGAAALVLKQNSRLEMYGKIGLIENQECFLHAKRMQIDVDAVIYTAGRLSGIALQHLSAESMSGCTYMHCPDYDPVGLTEYMRYKSILKDRVSLFVPDDLRQLLKKYGKQALLQGRNGQMMQLLRKTAPPELRNILQWMDEANAGLEQEVLIGLRSAAYPS